MRNGPSILQRNVVPHLVVHVSHSFEKGRLHINLHVLRESQFVKLQQTHVVANDLLGEVRAIERVNAVGADCAPLNLYSTPLVFELVPIFAAFLGQTEGHTREEVCGAEHFTGMCKQLRREGNFLFFLHYFLGFHVIVNEGNL